MGGWWGTVDVEDLELHAVDVEVVLPGFGDDLPDLDGAGDDGGVDAVHRHVLAVDLGSAHPEGAGVHGVGAVEPLDVGEVAGHWW